jgi:hypothetical protein
MTEYSIHVLTGGGQLVSICAAHCVNDQEAQDFAKRMAEPSGQAEYWRGPIYLGRVGAPESVSVERPVRPDGVNPIGLPPGLTL